MKKSVLGLTIASLALLTNPAFADTKLKLVEVLTSPARTETLKEIIGAYEAAHPGVTVEIVSMPWGQAYEKLATMVAGGDVPDVVEMPDKWQALYAGADKLVNLEDHIKNWDHGATLTDKTMAMARLAGGTAYSVPYGFYLRAMFYNKKLLAEAGVDTPPKTMEEFHDALAKVSALDGKSGYCLRGGRGGHSGWLMNAATMNGSADFFTEDGKSTLNTPEAIKGYQELIDIYQDGLAPKDSVNWGFNEIVAGFYSGTCAFLDQDPDALIAVQERMENEDFAVIPMPTGPHGKAYPTIGFVGWSIFNATEHESEAWDLVAHLSDPENNKTWARKVGVIPVHTGADQDPYFQTEQFAGWFEELNSPDYVPLVLPHQLEGFGYFADTIAVETSQQALLGEITAKEMADQWAAYMEDEYAKWKANQ